MRRVQANYSQVLGLDLTIKIKHLRHKYYLWKCSEGKVELSKDRRYNSIMYYVNFISKLRGVDFTILFDSSRDIMSWCVLLQTICYNSMNYLLLFQATQLTY